MRTTLLLVVTGLLVLGSLPGCDQQVSMSVQKSPASVRATRRAFDGAPPVIPHGELGATCTECHGKVGMEVPDLGYSPPNPHGETLGLSDASRCRQCHVHKLSDETFVANNFDGLKQDLRKGKRLHDLAPPVIPHSTFMRENCSACHSGPAAREEIRCTHPERTRCQQCHLQRSTVEEFPSR